MKRGHRRGRADDGIGQARGSIGQGAVINWTGAGFNRTGRGAPRPYGNRTVVRCKRGRNFNRTIATMKRGHCRGRADDGIGQARGSIGQGAVINWTGAGFNRTGRGAPRPYGNRTVVRCKRGRNFNRSIATMKRGHCRGRADDGIGQARGTIGQGAVINWTGAGFNRTGRGAPRPYVNRTVVRCKRGRNFNRTIATMKRGTACRADDGIGQARGSIGQGAVPRAPTSIEPCCDANRATHASPLRGRNFNRTIATMKRGHRRGRADDGIGQARGSIGQGAVPRAPTSIEPWRYANRATHASPLRGRNFNRTIATMKRGHCRGRADDGIGQARGSIGQGAVPRAPTSIEPWCYANRATHASPLRGHRRGRVDDGIG
jgi:hypothetical protein